MSKHREVSFWVSYSDLATALMIVFVVVMLMMVAVAMKDREAQSGRVEDLASQIQVILGARQSLASAIGTAMAEAPKVGESGSAAMPRVDPVTAQLSLPEEALRFGSGQASMAGDTDRSGRIDGEEYLERFAPAYFCALWKHECRGCTGRLDPERPQGVRRVLISGHTDLRKGTDGSSFETNTALGAARAVTVAKFVGKVLKDCTDGQCGGDALVPPACKGRMGEVWRYAQERIWAGGAGYTAHCSDALGTLSCWTDDEKRDPLVAEINDQTDCDEDLYGCVSSDHRRVDFVLELTGDDMTGMLLDVLALQREVSGALSDDLVKMATDVGENCMGPERSYQGCPDYESHCVRPGAADWEECRPLFDHREDALQ